MVLINPPSVATNERTKERKKERTKEWTNEKQTNKLTNYIEHNLWENNRSPKWSLLYVIGKFISMFIISRRFSLFRVGSVQPTASYPSHWRYINLPSTPRSSGPSLSFRFPRQNLYALLFYPYVPPAPPITPPCLDHLNPLNAELNSICHLLALLGAHPILHVSVIKVNNI
jgi:hypothetical protein